MSRENLIAGGLQAWAAFSQSRGLVADRSPPHCAITQSGINFVLDVLGGFLNASDYAAEMYAAGRWYAYGWDQSPWQAWPAVKSLYSAVKEKFPLLSTAAVLESAPNGLPCLPPVLDS